MKNKVTKLFEKAYGNFGVGAFNVFTAEQVQSVFAGASLGQAPVLIAITPAARRYLRPLLLEGMIRGAREAFPEVLFSVHLDHGDRRHCFEAIGSGFYSSIMIDGSHLSFDENVAITSEVVQAAHPQGVAVEAELGIIGGVEDDISVEAKRARCTDPEKAVEFVERTGCDSLAIAIGTSHGAYKFEGSGMLELTILERIAEKLPCFPLVLHGASAVPHREIERINAAGGKLRVSASGVPDDEIHAAILRGVCKINIATDMRLIWCRTHREFFRDEPEKFDRTVPGATEMEALSDFVFQKCKLLGASGKAPLLKKVLDE